ncbi:MAG TPA: putative baseplate assembly protein [Polyangiales bacterium]|nr:putative baseplate assembly protein [Polyangiales bacterium]
MSTHCGGGAPCSSGCCDGTAVSTPVSIYNRPGLDQIAYRIGEHGTFLETMLARLTSSDFPALAGLTTRASDDPSLALLDAWATIADVLTFYQERIANEGYLRTATERRSVLELARLIGYQPRPGVAASAYLAYTVDSNAIEPVEVPAGARVQSVPGPGELPQTFETSEKFIARKEWNEIKPRVKRPQTARSILEGTDEQPGTRVYLQGTGLTLQVNDLLLIGVGDLQPAPFRITRVVEDAKELVTRVEFVGLTGDPLIRPVTELRRLLGRLDAAIIELALPASLGVQVLLPLRSFIAWILDEYADPLKKNQNVQEFVRTRWLVEAVVELMDRMRSAALSPVDASALGRIVLKIVVELETNIFEIFGEDDLAERAYEMFEAIKAAVENATPVSLAAQQDERLRALSRGLVSKLLLPPSQPPRNRQALQAETAALFDPHSDVGTRMLAALQPGLAGVLGTANRNLRAAPDTTLRVYRLRQRALLFGATAPLKVTIPLEGPPSAPTEWDAGDMQTYGEDSRTLYLDGVYDKLRPGGWALIDMREAQSSGPLARASEWLIGPVLNVTNKTARAAYFVSAPTTRLQIADGDGQVMPWFIKNPNDPSKESPFSLIRKTVVHFDSEELVLAEEPITTEVCGGDEWLELDALVDGLEAGRWLLINGERSDVTGTTGVGAGELVMLEAVRQYVEKQNSGNSWSDKEPNGEDREGAVYTAPKAPAFLPGDKLHTYIKLANPLRYCYKRDTVTINANVVKASHGETTNEVLGAGDTSKSLQRFKLRRPPVTFVAAPTPAGAQSTLRVYVNDVAWHESEAMLDLGPQSRGFVTSISDDGVTTVTFGNGVQGARLPTGLENVRAVYRSGIGSTGNVRAGQLSQLMTRPLGIKSVTNPLAASGGANTETRDQARRNAPLAVQSLGRLVSTADYADFARTFAGIGKAVSARLADDGVECVFLTIAGADDVPIDTTSDLFMNLIAALRANGDPYQAFRVQMRERMLLVLNARLAIDPDYVFEEVVDRVRAGLLDRFSFERRDLAQSVARSEVIACMQATRGVLWVDVDALGAVSELDAGGAVRAPQDIAEAAKQIFDDAKSADSVVVRGIRRDKEAKLIRPAQMAFFVPSVPETLLLTRVQP